ncbi:hypothetical protein SAMN05216570_0645 [Dyella sp. OK004]|uniref:hypothetical protein n=1 Tax=Dyella sp. OK004 TaxID=1855292 RepID=UPI0008E2A98C|nr:hypothetical protein [Dyella sp. OK004]SFR92166.1 hypothetical protein SAMN05216570_0645 [Dyella sp. OK004]
MLLKVRRDAAHAGRGFAAWRIALWLLLLLAAFGGVQYLRYAQYPYLVGAFAVIVVCVGCIMQQEWARRAMRVLAVLLALWSLATGGLMLAQWGQFEQARQAAQAQPQLAELATMMIEHAKRIFEIVLVIKAVAVPVLLWLSWQLGLPAVRKEFHTRPV